VQRGPLILRPATDSDPICRRRTGLFISSETSQRVYAATDRRSEAARSLRAWISARVRATPMPSETLPGFCLRPEDVSLDPAVPRLVGMRRQRAAAVRGIRA